MFIVTGGAGFIGSNLIHELNAHGITEILVVDNLTNTKKFSNLVGARFIDYLDKREFRRAIAERSLGTGLIDAIFHQGACSNTLEDDGVYMMDNNFQYTKEVLAFAIQHGVRWFLLLPRQCMGIRDPAALHPLFKMSTHSTSTDSQSLHSTTFSEMSWRRNEFR